MALCVDTGDVAGIASALEVADGDASLVESCVVAKSQLLSYESVLKRLKMPEKGSTIFHVEIDPSPEGSKWLGYTVDVDVSGRVRIKILPIREHFISIEKKLDSEMLMRAISAAENAGCPEIELVASKTELVKLKKRVNKILNKFVYAQCLNACTCIRLEMRPAEKLKDAFCEFISPWCTRYNPFAR